MKDELEKEKKTFQALLNNGLLNLPEDNMKSIAELRMSALPLRWRLGSL